jgi:two-component system, LuxR family, response regulator FixJ
MTTEADAHVIDDDQAVRESIEFLLRSAQLTVRTYESASAFLAVAPTVGSGCVITDVRMPGITGIDLLRRLKEMGLRLPVIVITGHGDVPLAVEAMKFGAVDFLEKPFDDDVLLASVRSALDRSEASAQLETERAEIRARIALLTNREHEVLDGLVAGHPNKIIAFDLSISPRTVEIYRANVMTKMKAGSLSELVRMTLAAGVMKSQTDS